MAQAFVAASTAAEATTIYTWLQGALIHLTLTSLSNKATSTITTIRAVSTLANTIIQARLIVAEINRVLAMQASEAILTQTMWLVVVIVLVA